MHNAYALVYERLIDKVLKIGIIVRAKTIYSDLQKHESSCLLSDRFWCISPEPFELQKIFLPLFTSLFDELSDRK